MSIKQHINVVFIGHVDAGKSTLCGSILLECGMIDQRTIEKVKETAKAKGMESWWKAFFLDTNEEEQEKGKTVECARSHFETENCRFTILDAPGHKAYVPNMINGTSQADVAILVISARKGEFESGFQRGGQTREHTTLAKTLGVSELVIVINKMDEDGVEWQKQRYDEIITKFSSFLKKTGFNPKKVKWVPISAYRGENIKENKKLDWYNGKSLLNTLDEIRIDRDKIMKKDLRIPILDSSKESGKIKLIGKIESGSLSIKDTLVAIPGEKEFKIASIDSEFGNNLQSGICGDNIVITAKDLSERLGEGDVLVKKGESFCPVSDEFIAQLKITEMPEKRPVFTAGYSAILHLHTTQTEVKCTKITAEIDPKTKEHKKTRFGRKGSMLIAKFKCEQPIPMEKFENFNQLGRFTIRDEGITVCIGKILKIKNKST